MTKKSLLFGFCTKSNFISSYDFTFGIDSNNHLENLHLNEISSINYDDLNDGWGRNDERIMHDN